MTNRSDRPSWAHLRKDAKGAHRTSPFEARGRENVRTLKGMGPNKASGHKGGISRQGSKRG